MKTTLVLNSYYVANSTVNLRKALKLILNNKAEVLAYSETETYKTVSSEQFVPTVIRLLNCYKYNNSSVKFAKKRLFIRDKSCCCYCGKIITKRSDITIDHVIPSSRGGKTTWENCVTACKKCNSFKSNKTPEEANLFMVFQPYKPKNYSALMMFDGDVKEEWKPYLSQHLK
jgi:5-methylcytosine-specific restriction endonuclease McrA